MKLLKLPFTGWILTFDNGDTLFQDDKGNGHKSSWQEAIDLIQQHHKKPIKFMLVTPKINIVAINKAQGYFYAREIRLTVLGIRLNDNREGIGSINEDKVFITWLDKNGNIQQEIRELSHCIQHTTLRSTQNDMDCIGKSTN